MPGGYSREHDGDDDRRGREHRGWHTPRGLPHFDSAETTQAITFRLADALPKEVVVARGDATEPAYRRRIEAALDAGAGACWLRRPEIARIVEAALHHGDGVAYDLHAYVVMPNHVHVLMTQRPGRRLADTVQAWKGFSARAINAAWPARALCGSAIISIASCATRRISNARAPTSRRTR